MSAKDSALELLSQGLSASQTAATIGVHESYVSQLLSQEDFRAALESKRVALSQEELAYDQKLDRVEGKFLERIDEKAGFANLQQSLQAFRILNSAKRRRDTAQTPAGTQIGTVVVLQLPSAAIPRYILNNQSEIVDVEGATMVSASPKGVEEMLKEKKQREAAAKSTETLGLQTKLESQDNSRAQDLLALAAPVKKSVRRVPDFMNVENL